MVQTRRRNRLAAAFGLATALLIGSTFMVAPAANAQTEVCRVSDFKNADGTLDITSYLACFGAINPDNPPGPECPTGTLSIATAATPAEVAPGGSTSITLSGYAPGSQVTVTLCGNGIATVLGTFTADADGKLSFSVTIPSNTPCGNYNLANSGVRASNVSQVAYAPLVVTCTTTVRGSLPVTGSDTGQLIGLAMVLMALGGAAAFGSRRMKSRSEDGLTGA